MPFSRLSAMEIYDLYLMFCREVKNGVLYVLCERFQIEKYQRVVLAWKKSTDTDFISIMWSTFFLYL